MKRSAVDDLSRNRFADLVFSAFRGVQLLADASKHGKAADHLRIGQQPHGDVAYGSAVIRAFADVVRPFPDVFRFVFKLQYRDLDSFIHPASKGRDDVKYVKRFESTGLGVEACDALLAVMRECDFLTALVPFDEPSVNRIESQGIDIFTIASCSFTDWPLLERAAKVDKPIIASTVGATLADIDAVVSVLQHRNKRLTILHCVAECPTPPEKLAIN